MIATRCSRTLPRRRRKLSSFATKPETADKPSFAYKLTKNLIMVEMRLRSISSKTKLCCFKAEEFKNPRIRD